MRLTNTDRSAYPASGLSHSAPSPLSEPAILTAASTIASRRLNGIQHRLREDREFYFLSRYGRVSRVSDH